MLPVFPTFLCMTSILLHILRTTAPLLRQRATPYINRAVQRELPLIRQLQKLRCRPVTFIVDLSGLMVSYEFYILVLPVMLWAGYPHALALTVFVSVVNYLGQHMKDLFCALRPLHLVDPGVHLDSQNVFASYEYGLPSCHASNSIGFFGGLLIAFTQSEVLQWPWPGLYVAFLAAFLTSLICFGRVYNFMHSLTDIVGGIALGVASLALLSMLPVHFERWVVQHPWTPLQFFITSLFALWLYPKPHCDTPSFGDAVVFLGAAGGMLYGVAHAWELYETQMQHFNANDTQHWRILGIQTLVGLTFSVAVKELCRRVTQPIFLALFSCIPLKIRCIWQFPVHSQQQANHATRVDDGQQKLRDAQADMTHCDLKDQVRHPSAVTCRSL